MVPVFGSELLFQNGSLSLLRVFVDEEVSGGLSVVE
jgi:hypothetical protein